MDASVPLQGQYSCEELCDNFELNLLYMLTLFKSRLSYWALFLFFFFRVTVERKHKHLKFLGESVTFFASNWILRVLDKRFAEKQITTTSSTTTSWFTCVVMVVAVMHGLLSLEISKVMWKFLQFFQCLKTRSKLKGNT